MSGAVDTVALLGIFCHCSFVPSLLIVSVDVKAQSVAQPSCAIHILFRGHSLPVAFNPTGSDEGLHAHTCISGKNNSHVVV